MSTPVTVLIIDDAAGVRAALTEILRSQGYGVYTAATASEAEAMLRQRGTEAVQLVVADIQLTPDPQAREGYTLYQRWTAVDAGLPFILMSGDARHQTLPDIRTGAVQLLLKPVAVEVLLEAIRQVLGR